jgi:NitT/TauT family transport system substrate-binding protein
MTSIVALWLLVPLVWTGLARAQTRVTIGQGFVNAHAAPLWVAVENGYFRKHGIEPDLRLVRGGATTTAALLNGELKLAAVALTQVVGPVTRGADLVVIASLVDKLSYRLMVGPPVRTPEDLKGRRLGVATLSGSAYVASRLALKHFGLDPKRDRIGLLQIGTEPERLAALVAGSVDGAMVLPSIASRLPTPPYRMLMDFRHAGIPWIHTCLVTTRDFVGSRRPGVVEGALRAVVEGAAFVLDPRNADSVRVVIARHLRLDDPAAVEESYRDAVEEIAWKPVPDLAGVATVLETMAALGIVEEAARLKPGDLVDPSIMQRLDQEGLLDRLRPRK